MKFSVKGGRLISISRRSWNVKTLEDFEVELSLEANGTLSLRWPPTVPLPHRDTKFKVTIEWDESDDLEPFHNAFSKDKRSMNKPKASDILDSQILDAITTCRYDWHLQRHPNDPPMACLWDIQAAMSEFPPKVVLAKLRSMVKRQILSGCDCGCRGDFQPIAKVS